MNTQIAGRTNAIYYQDNKTIVQEKVKIYQNNNKAKYREYDKEYYMDNKEALTTYKKLHYQINKVEILEKNNTKNRLKTIEKRLTKIWRYRKLIK